jgi:hypothetical protein
MRLHLSPLISTPLQRGVGATCEALNRFSGLSGARETVKTFSSLHSPQVTPLKWGANQRQRVSPDISHPISTDALASRRSAGFQPAVSPISNRQGVEIQPRLPGRERRRLEAQRYGRLEICATEV